MNNTVTSFFSRDAFLKRSSRTRTRKESPVHLQLGSPSRNDLHIIPECSEDDEPRSSYSSISDFSRSPSPLLSSSSTKSKRRHANLRACDIRLAREILIDSGLEGFDETLLLATQPPRPAPRPPQDPSPDSFHLTFSDLTFPRPPLPTPSSLKHDGSSSPTPSLTTSTSSPASNSAGLPVTPMTSDDEEFTTRTALPRRTSIKPLFITKHNSSATTQPPADSDPDSDTDEATAWYSREFSDLITLCSPLPPSFPHPARRDSLSLPAPAPVPAPAPKRSRMSKPLPALPSAQLDPAFPRRTHTIPAHAPPPVPPIPQHFRPRPPPRMSVPDDVDFFLDIDDDACTASSGSIYSQPDDDAAPPFADLDFGADIAFELDLDIPMRLPLSLPGSPLDLEADIACGLEQLRMSNDDRDDAQDREERVLRSRWSSSTLGSAHEARGTAARLRGYFGGASPRKPRISGPLSPGPASPAFSARGQERTVRRRGSRSSTSTSASGSSEESCGSGLRRKPIPVEMFLRSAV